MGDVTIEMPELGLVGTTTLSDERVIELTARQTRGAPAPQLATRVRLGGPDAARMRPTEDEDPRIADRRGDADFWAVLMALTFEPAERESLASAWLRVDLRGASPGGPAPIAFAMDPGRQEEAVGVETGGGLEANVKVLKATAAAKRTYTLHEAEILALGRLRSDPAWEIAPVSGRPLRGGSDFVLVVKAPSGGGGSGTVSFGATIAWTESGFLRRREHEVSWKGDPVEFPLA